MNSREERNAYMRSYNRRRKIEDPAFKQYYRDYQREYMRDFKWERALTNKYGVSKAWFLETYDAQGGRCAICGTDNWSSRNRRPNIDHNHVTGHVRGLLCDRCNLGLGSFGDSLDVLQNAALYLTVFE